MNKNDYVTYNVNVKYTGSYEVKLRMKNTSASGKLQLSVNGTNLGAVMDTYSATSAFQEYTLGTQAFSAAGNQSFKLTITGKNASSTGYVMLLDSIISTPQ